MSKATFADQVIDYHFNLSSDWDLPSDIHLLYPFREDDTKEAFSGFYKKYFSDHRKRHYLFGINPGRFGAGVTGVPFTDPIILENECQINNPFKKKNELSAIFVYDFIHALGGIESFYSHFYISSVCPLGFVKEGKNYNYYDDNELYQAVKPKIVDNIKTQKEFGVFRDVAFCMGKGKNFKFFVNLNKEYHFFDRIVPLPHPRWVMQYKLKSKEIHIDTYVNELSAVL